MKKLLVYLHSFGADKTENQELVQKMAQQLGVEYFSIQADMPSGRERGGFGWYPITPAPERKNILDDYFIFSLGGIVGNILRYIQEGLDDTISNYEIIFCGCSQGAVMAIASSIFTEILPISKVIAINAFIPEGFMERLPIVRKGVPILWIEGAKDDVVPPDLKATHKLLSDEEIEITFKISKNSAHTDLSDDILELI